MAVRMENKRAVNVAKQFYRAARKNCPSAYRKKLKETLTAGLTDYIEANPQADMAALTAHFGCPEDFANELINEMTAQEKQQMLKRAKVGKWCALIATAVFVITVIISAIIIVKKNNEAAAHFYYYELDVSEGEEV